MYNDEKLHSVRSLVAVHILNFRRDLVVMLFIRTELAKWIELKYIYMYVMSHKQSALSLKYIYIYIYGSTLHVRRHSIITT